MTRLEAIKSKITEDHIDVYLNTVRTIEFIDKLAEQHRILTASQAIAGIKPDGEKEALFYDVLNQVRDATITILEKEVEDWQHRGDKNYRRYFD